jgi:Uma2 family endonuclease
MGYEQPIADADAEGPTRHKLTVEEFLILDEAGAFPTDRTELIDGEIFELSPVHEPHASVLLTMSYELEAARRRLGSSLRAYSPVSTLIDNFNLPQSDLMLAEGGGDGFIAGSAVRLAIEVSSSALRHDLVKNAKLSAAALILEYWVVDVHGRRIVQMHTPIAGAYSQRVENTFGSPITSATIPGLIVDTAAL